MRQYFRVCGKILLSFLVIIMLGACNDSGDSQEPVPVEEDNTSIDVPVVIDGYTLPPDPGEAGKKTLLGVDSNQNGVRDDVEIWIYTTYEKPVERAVSMQTAKAYQVVIEEPEKASENFHYMHDAVDCISYYKRWADFFGEELLIDKSRDFEEEMNPIQFNTKERYMSYQKYNHELTGGVYSSAKPENKKSKCDFNTSTYR